MSSKSLDWLLIGRYSLLIALTALIPVPWLDLGIENYLRRRMVRAIAARHDVLLSDDDVRTLAHAPSGGCMGCVWSIVLWPIRKVLKTALFVWQAKSIADASSELIHRGLMVEEALEQGWLPGDAQRVRMAMDTALDKIDTRVVERQLRGVFQDHTNELNGLIWKTTELARARAKGERSEAVASAVEADALGSGADLMSAAMLGAVRGTGLVPELLQWFRAEMGSDPRPETQVAGLLEADEILPPDEAEEPAEEGEILEDAEEISQGDAG